MKTRAQSEIVPARTKWDDMLAETRPLRNIFRFGSIRKEIFFHLVTEPCVHEARLWLQRISLLSDGEHPCRISETTLPEWTRKEYLAQPPRPWHSKLEMPLEAEEDSVLKVSTDSSAGRKSEPSICIRRSKRLRILDEEAASLDDVQK